MELTVDDFLEHHGVLGMHWGRRKAEVSGESGDSSSFSPPPSSGMSSKPNHHARNVAISVGLVGLVGSALILRHRSNVQFSMIEKNKQFEEGLKILEQNKNIKMSAAIKKFDLAKPGSPEYKAALNMMDEANYLQTIGVNQLRERLMAK